jgi:hypothetical protein
LDHRRAVSRGRHGASERGFASVQQASGAETVSALSQVARLGGTRFHAAKVLTSKAGQIHLETATW